MALEAKKKHGLMKIEKIEGQSFVQTSICHIEKDVVAAITQPVEWSLKSLTSLILQFRYLSTEKGECH